MLTKIRKQRTMQYQGKDADSEFKWSGTKKTYGDSCTSPLTSS